jgi:predicted HTH domain antitoxin
MYECIHRVKTMPRTTSTIPDDLHQLIEGSIEAGIFENKSDAIRHALRDYFEDHDDARLAAAIHLYEREAISLGKAARLADVSRFDMPEILRDHGVEVRLGPEDMDDAQQEIDAARDLE